MKKIITFLIFTLLVSNVFSIDMGSLKKELKKEAMSIGEGIDKVAEQRAAEQKALNEQYNKIVHAKKNYFKYTGSNKYHIVMSGLHYYDFNGSDEYFVPLAIMYDDNGKKIYSLEKNDDQSTFVIKSVTLAFSNNNKWYVGRLHIVNPMPDMEVMEVRSKKEAIVIMTEMFTTRAWADSNCDMLGFDYKRYIDSYIDYIDNDNVDWASCYNFRIFVPAELVGDWDWFGVCDTTVDVIKGYKLDNQIISPYDFCTNHRLSLCDNLGCIASRGGYISDSNHIKYVIEPYCHHIYGDNYNPKYHTAIDITKFDTNYTLEIIE